MNALNLDGYYIVIYYFYRIQTLYLNLICIEIYYSFKYFWLIRNLVHLPLRAI